MRFWKSFVTLSRRLAVKEIEDEIVPFKEQLHKFEFIYQLPKGLRLYLMMEGISLLVQDNYVISYRYRKFFYKKRGL